MGTPLLHRLRRHRRAIASAALALFVANWLTLALAPCALAYGAPAAAAAAAPVALPNAEPCGHCPPPEAPPCHAHDAAAAPANPSTCEAVPKPAIDVRDSNPSGSVLLLALAAPVVDVLPVTAGPVVRAVLDPRSPPDFGVLERFGRRLE